MTSKIIKIDKKAEKELAKIFSGDKSSYYKIKDGMLKLIISPHSGKPLHGDKKGCYRLRIGDYRIIYEISGDEIWILKIGHRKDIYR